MPIDPTIITRGLQPIQHADPLALVNALGAIQDQRAQTEARRLAADEARMRAAAAARAQESEQRLRDMVVPGPDGQPTIDWQKGYGYLGADKVLAVQKGVAELTETMAKAKAAGDTWERQRVQYLGGIGRTVQNTGYDPDIFNDGVTAAQAGGYLSDKEAEQLHAYSRDPAVRQRAADHAVALAEGAKPPELAEVPTVQDGVQGTTFVPKRPGTFVPGVPKAAGAETHSPIYREWQDYKAEGGPLDFNAYMTADANRKATRVSVSGAGGGGGGTDAEDEEAIADAIANYLQPPTVTGLYRHAAGVRARLAKKRFNLAEAQTNWTATQRHYATLNGAQQTRLRQAIDTATESLDVIDSLAGQWKGTGFPVLNKINLAAATHGVYGPQAAAIASKLQAQITDVTSELAQVYMGGNSPTDHAMELARKNLSADWSEKVLKEMTQLARTNLRLRTGAINDVPTMGVSGVNPYAPTAPVTPPTGRYNPATGKIE